MSARAVAAARDPTPEPFTRLRRIGGLRASLGRALHGYHRLVSRHRLQSVVVERVAGRALVVMPGVLNPSLMRTGAFFAQALEGDPLLEDADVLDLGTGTGICALVAACRARRVVAVDVSPTAVRCAGVNVLLNGFERKIDVLQGDLFAPVRGRRFDLILFNPPFLVGEPRDDADRAWRSVDIGERFAAGLGDQLAPGGSALLLLSTFGDADVFLRPLASRHFAIAVRARRGFINERLTLLRVWSRSTTRAGVPSNARRGREDG